MKNLSNEEISQKGKIYDNIQNEGGSGYNPYWEESKRRDIEEAQKRAAQPKTKEEQIDALHDRIRIECGAIAREWNEKEVDKKKSELYAEINLLEKEIEVEFKAEWTEEVTASRRIEWNDFAKLLIGNSKKMTREMMDGVNNRQKEQGWKLGALKKAVTIYK